MMYRVRLSVVLCALRLLASNQLDAMLEKALNEQQQERIAQQLQIIEEVIELTRNRSIAYLLEAKMLAKKYGSESTNLEHIQAILDTEKRTLDTFRQDLENALKSASCELSSYIYATRGTLRTQFLGAHSRSQTVSHALAAVTDFCNGNAELLQRIKSDIQDSLFV